MEGTESSLDKPLYSLIFPMVSVIPKGSCHDVERAVVGGRAGERFHWLRAFGIVDGDGYASDEILRRRERGIYAVPFYSVEAIYFHPRIIGWIAARQANVSGESASNLTKRALERGVACIRDHTERLSKKVVKKSIRKRIFEQIPNDDDLLIGQSITLKNAAKEILAERVHELDTAVENGDWQAILTKASARVRSAKYYFGNSRIPRHWGLREFGASSSSRRQ